MVADKKSSEVSTSRRGAAPLSKEEAARRLAAERKTYKTEKAEWAEETTVYDHLPKEERPFNIEPFGHERQRVPFKLSDEDRRRRQAWVESQTLADHEPAYVPELQRMIYNPIRRLYRLPTDKVFQALAPIVGEHRAPMLRYVVPKLFIGWLTGCAVWYHLKYNRSSWEEWNKGTSVWRTNAILMPVSSIFII